MVSRLLKWYRYRVIQVFSNPSLVYISLLLVLTSSICWVTVFCDGSVRQSCRILSSEDTVASSGRIRTSTLRLTLAQRHNSLSNTCNSGRDLLVSPMVASRFNITYKYEAGAQLFNLRTQSYTCYLVITNYLNLVKPVVILSDD